MPVDIFLCKEFDHKHEEDFFELFINEVSNSINETQYAAILANVSISGYVLDNLILKNNAITIVDFKDYGGSFEFKENGIWETNNGVQIKGGSLENPFEQLSQHRRKLQEFLTNNSNDIFVNNKPELKHISAVTLFHKPIKVTNWDIAPGPIKYWFKITDINNFSKELKQTKSNKISLSQNEIRAIVDKLGYLKKYQKKTKVDIVDENLSRLIFDYYLLRKKKSIISNSQCKEEDLPKYNKGLEWFNSFPEKLKANHKYLDEIEKENARELQKKLDTLLNLKPNFNSDLTEDEILDYLSKPIQSKFLKSSAAEYLNFIVEIHKQQNGKLPIAVIKEFWITVFYLVNRDEVLDFVKKVKYIIENCYQFIITNKSINYDFLYKLIYSFDPKILHAVEKIEHINNKFQFPDKLVSFHKEITTYLREKLGYTQFKNFVKFLNIGFFIDDENEFKLDEVNFILTSHHNELLKYDELNANKSDKLKYKPLFVYHFELFNDSSFITSLNIPISCLESLKPAFEEELYQLNNTDFSKWSIDKLKQAHQKIHEDFLKKLDEKSIYYTKSKLQTEGFDNPQYRTQQYLNKFAEILAIEKLGSYNWGNKGNSIPEKTYNKLIKEFIEKEKQRYDQKFQEMLIEKQAQSSFKKEEVIPPSSSIHLKNNLYYNNNQSNQDELIFGYEDIKNEIRKHLVPLTSEFIRNHTSLPSPDGILFYGPPGCGKTVFAKWVASELNYKFIEVPRSSFGSPYVDGAMNNLIAIINEIKKGKNQVVFFDEFDSVAIDRSNPRIHDESAKIVNTLLQEIQKITELGNIVIAATNFLHKLDDAATRSGRFGIKIPIYPPNSNEKAIILESYIKKYTKPKKGYENQNSIELNAIFNELLGEHGLINKIASSLTLYSNADLEGYAKELVNKIVCNFENKIKLDISSIMTQSGKKPLKCEPFIQFKNDLEKLTSIPLPKRYEELIEELDKGGCTNGSKSNIGFKKN